MEMTTDRAGETESGKAIPIGTKCNYLCHVPGGMVKVEMTDGTTEIVHPHIFAVLR